jgi:hypothetical protein
MPAALQLYEVGRPYTTVAHHADHGSANRMHADGLPQKLGFRGAFVLGLATYGNMTRSLVGQLGEEWLRKAVIEIKFIKPVCEGETLRVETKPIAGREKERAYEVTAYNESNHGEVAAVMQTWKPDPFPVVDAHASLKPIEWEGPVNQRRTWDTMVIEKPYRSLRYTPTMEHQTHWVRILNDDLPLYRTGEHPPLHPTQVLRNVQMGSTNQYIGDNAIHGGTRAVIHEMLRVGDPLDVLTVPVKKWEKKGNHWVTLYAAVRTGGRVCAEIFHTQIFKVRGAEAVLGIGKSA